MKKKGIEIIFPFFSIVYTNGRNQFGPSEFLLTSTRRDVGRPARSSEVDVIGAWDYCCTANNEPPVAICEPQAVEAFHQMSYDYIIVGAGDDLESDDSLDAWMMREAPTMMIGERVADLIKRGN